MTVYYVEDDENIRQLVLYALTQSGIQAEGQPDDTAFRAACAKSIPDVVVLDIMLPEEDGLSILEKLRADVRYKNLPVILLTAKGSEYDKVLGFEKGADDYIPKPFGMMEMVARVKALLRRSTQAANTQEYTVGPLYVCPSSHLVKVDGQEIALTLKEFELLCLLLEKKNLVLTRDQLLNRIWGYSFDGENRTVDVHIRTLRQKLGSAGNLIETVRGVGYKIPRP